MAKAKTIFVCSECGNESPKWLGKCPACNSWNTFYEQKIEKYTEENKIEKKINNTPKPLNTYIGQEANRTSTILALQYYRFAKRISIIEKPLSGTTRPV